MKRVPISKCRKCPHFKDGGCLLADLEPCRYYNEDEDATNRFLTIVTALCLGAIAVMMLLAFGCTKPEPQLKTPEITPTSVCEMLRAQRGSLSEWEQLQLAIAYTESKFNPAAVGAAQDCGIMQITPIYIAELNRITGAENYTLADAFDIHKTLEMFEVMQAKHNPAHDRDQAIKYHNRSPYYKAEVLRNLELIKRYEAVRAALKDRANDAEF